MAKDQSNHWQLIAFLLIGVIVGYGFGQVLPVAPEVSILGAGDKNDPIEVKVGDPTTTPEPDFVLPDADDDVLLGDKKAKITIIEFSDYQCSFCQRFYLNTFGQLVENYIDTGLVNYVHRDFPLSFHMNAVPAAEAAECAGEQDKYWEMHSAIFDNLSEWESSSEIDQLLAVYATEIGLDIDKFESCTASDKKLAEIQGDMDDGIAAGVSATPTFFINGEKVVGAQPYSVFSSILDSLL